MRRATALIALVLAGPAAAITVPPALMPPTPPPLTTLPPAAQPMQTVTGLRTGITPRQRMVPPQLTEEERAAFRQIFLDLDAGRLTAAEKSLIALPAGLLSETARAALIVARGTGKLTRADLVTWLTANPDLPLSPKIARLADALPGGDSAPLPLLPEARPFRTASGTGFRTESAPADGELSARLKPLLAADRNDEAERLWLAQAQALSPFARADLAARIA